MLALKALGATATNSQVVSELNFRNYFAQVATPAATVTATVTAKPVVTQAQILGLAVDASLQYYGYAIAKQSSPVYLSTQVWSNIVNYAINISTQISTQLTSQGYAVSGMSGLRGLGQLSWWDTYGHRSASDYRLCGYHRRYCMAAAGYEKPNQPADTGGDRGLLPDRDAGRRK